MLEGYSISVRMDRETDQGGGVLVPTKDKHNLNVTHTLQSEAAERVWCVVHTDFGPVSVATLYRPPRPGEVETIRALREEWLSQRSSCVEGVVLGDLNVHSIRWLRHSSRETAEGTQLAGLCDDLGIKQMVREPTRGRHLLDLALTDMEGLQVRVVPGISGHQIVTTRLRMPVPTSTVISRTVWDYNRGDWDSFKEQLAVCQVEKDANATDAVKHITGSISCGNAILFHLQDYPRKEMHPPLGERPCRSGGQDKTRRPRHSG